MRVLQINTVCGRGSTGRIAADLLTALEERGQQGKIAYGIAPAVGVDPKDTIQIDSKFEYYVHNILSRISGKEGCYSARATRRLIKKIRAYRPEIIHLHNIHGHYLNYKLLFSFLSESKIPVVWTLHDCWPFTGHCAYFDHIGCEQWKSRCTSCPQLRRYPVCYTKGNSLGNYIEKRRSFTGLDHLVIVTPSAWLAALVKRSFLGEYPVKVINNGIDVAKFQPPPENTFRKRHNLEGKKVILGVASEWTERKGYADFIRLSRNLAEDQRLVLVGVGDRQRGELPNTVVAVRRTDRVEELAEIYSAADVLFNLTYEDNFPTVNLEAMACGTPVVTYRTGGSAESITPQTGYAVPRGDYCAALGLIDSAMGLDRGVIREIACKKYAAQGRYGAYLELYRSMMQSFGG